jgi:biopolymer transport protein ExbD
MAAPFRFEPDEGDRPPRVSFIPLIDVVLQIICFYLFVSAGVQTYQDASVQLPVMKSDALSGETPSEFTINIANDGAMNVNGASIDAATLPAALQAARAKAVETNQHLLVAIRADKRQPFAVLDRVLQACRDAQVPNVAIRAMTPTVGGGGGGVER